MKDQHPITPPPELFAEWLAEAKRMHPAESTGFIAGEVARLAYRAGADQELEACIELIKDHGWFANPEHRVNEVRAARRPKPPSLKEQALKVLSETELRHEWTAADEDIIRRALEQLDD